MSTFACCFVLLTGCQTFRRPAKTPPHRNPAPSGLVWQPNRPTAAAPSPRLSGTFLPVCSVVQSPPSKLWFRVVLAGDTNLIDGDRRHPPRTDRCLRDCPRLVLLFPPSIRTSARSWVVSLGEGGGCPITVAGTRRRFPAVDQTLHDDPIRLGCDDRRL